MRRPHPVPNRIPDATLAVASFLLENFMTKKLLLCCVIDAAPSQTLDQLVKDLNSRRLVRYLCTGEYEIAEPDGLERSVWLYASSDEMEPFMVVSGAGETEGTPITDLALEQLQAQAVCVEFHAHFPRSNPYGVPLHAAGEEYPLAKIGTFGFKAARQLAAYEAHARDTSTESCWLRLLAPAQPVDQSAEGEASKATKPIKFAGNLVTGDGLDMTVEFEAPVGATKAEKDAAFLAALAQLASLSYHPTTGLGDNDPLVGELRYFAVTGRIPGDDEDTQRVFRVASREEAISAFQDQLWSEEDDEDGSARDSVLREHGQSTFINSVVASDTPIEVC